MTEATDTPALAIHDDDAPAVVLAKLRGQAEALAESVRARWVRAWLDAVEALPAPEATDVWVALRSDGSVAQARLRAATRKDDALGGERVLAWEARTYGPGFFYEGRGGSPLAYARVLDWAAWAGVEGVSGASVLDVGFGTLGHLWMLAQGGARVVGVETDPVLACAYRAWSGDAPRQVGAGGGSVALRWGHLGAEVPWASPEESGWALVLTKNLLKRGFVAPEVPVAAHRRLALGTPLEAWVGAMARAMAPGGVWAIYNIMPPQNTGPGGAYVPWADGRVAFAREVAERAGLEAVLWERDDSAALCALGAALGWEGAETLRAEVTLLRKR